MDMLYFCYLERISKYFVVAQVGSCRLLWDLDYGRGVAEHDEAWTFELLAAGELFRGD